MEKKAPGSEGADSVVLLLNAKDNSISRGDGEGNTEQLCSVSFALQSLPRWTDSLTTINIPYPGIACKSTRAIAAAKLK